MRLPERAPGSLQLKRHVTQKGQREAEKQLRRSEYSFVPETFGLRTEDKKLNICEHKSLSDLQVTK